MCSRTIKPAGDPYLLPRSAVRVILGGGAVWLSASMKRYAIITQSACQDPYDIGTVVQLDEHVAHEHVIQEQTHRQQGRSAAKDA